jgi:hypothetical protein
MRTIVAAVALAVMLSPLIASASGIEDSPDISVIRDQGKELQSEVRERAGAFKDMDETDRVALIDHQDRLLYLLEGKQNREEMSQEEKSELTTLLTHINREVAEARDNRKVCIRVRTIGSNRAQPVCQSAKSAREMQDRPGR